MLETLLNHFRSYGMDDLDFVIVNSKMSHAQEKLHELTRRVSFDVYQETDEDEVWSVMEGGKDDMYVYDRCGRLTYYIPFPLSILNESPLVSNAILATYFRSPCGENCDTNTTFEIEDVEKNMDNDGDNATETMQSNSTYSEFEESMYVTETLIGTNETSNDTISNDIFNVIDSINTDDFNFNNTKNVTEYDYLSYTNTSHANETKDARIDKASLFFSKIYKLFFSNGNETDTMAENTPTNHSLSSVDQNNQQTSQNNTNNDVVHQNSVHHLVHDQSDYKHNQTDDIHKEKKKSDRCLEADFEVCRTWSKNRLLHAQKCCSEVGQSEQDIRTIRSCIHFGKKRCKKIQSILKCCIKTVYTEPAVETINHVFGTTTEGSTTDTKVEKSEVKTETNVVVCCRPAENGKICRVSNSTACEEGEQKQPNATGLP